jgi:hypothetical protein
VNLEQSGAHWASRSDTSSTHRRPSGRPNSRAHRTKAGLCPQPKHGMHDRSIPLSTAAPRESEHSPQQPGEQLLSQHRRLA